MKISFLTGLGQGGAERQVVETAKLLTLHKHTISIYAYGVKDLFYDIENINIIDIKIDNKLLPSNLNKLLSILKLLKNLKKDRPDFMISYITKLNVILGIVGLLVRGKIETKFLGSERNSRLRYNTSKVWRLLCKISYKGLNGIFSNSKEAIYNLNQVNFNGNKAYYLPNLLNIEYFTRQDNIRDNIDNKISILVPARITEQKNQKILIKVAERFKKSNIQMEFILAGNNDGLYADELREIIYKKELNEYFKIIGQVKDVKKMYNENLFVILPSLYEGLPNAIIEAMACECIVIGSDIPSISEIITDNKNGFLVNHNNDLEIYKKLLSIFNLGEEDKRNIQNKARENAILFGPENYYKNLVHILEEVKES